MEKFYKKYFIIVLFQAFLFCGHHAVISLLHKLSLEENVIEFLVQVTFISALLPHNMLANGSLWFLSAYLFGGVLAIWLYSMARNQKIMLATIIAVCAYNYIIISNGNVDVWFQNTAFVQFALIRAVGGISSGIVTFYIYEEVKCCNLSVLQLFVSRLIIFMAFATMVFYAWSGGHSALDIFIISLFSIFILCANLPQNYIKSGKTASFLESHAIPIYIFQQFIIDFTGHFMGRDIYRIIIVLIIDILVAILWSYFETSVLRITRLK